MAGLQTILNYCNGIEINRRKMVGIQYTRNEIPRVSSTPTKNPIRMTLNMPSSLRYSQARDLMEKLDTLDRITPEIITFSNLPQLSWIFKYQGAMNSTQLSAITVTSFVGSTLTLNVSGITASPTAVIFEPNDLIQIGSLGVHPFPFTSTTQVLRGSGSTVTVTTNRPNILTGNLTGLGVIVGNGCQFYMFCPNMPTYKLTPGGYVGYAGTATNNALLEWSDPFELYEWVGAA
jgi:hypothetical protein